MAHNPDAPKTAEELFRQDGSYIRKLVRRQLGSQACEEDISDVAQEIVLKLISRDVISMYDPGHASSASWRTFLGRQVMLYCRGMGETLGRRRVREVTVSTAPGDAVSYLADLLGATWDEYPHMGDSEFLGRIREHIAATPVGWTGTASLVDLFDLMVRRLKEGEKLPSRTVVQAEFNVSASAAKTGLGLLRQALRAAVGASEAPPVFDVAGVTMTASQVLSSLQALRLARGNRVAPALVSVDSPLAKCGTQWFITTGRREVREYPECKVPKGDKATHGSQTKVALIHLLERLLAPEPAQPQPEPAQWLEPEKPVTLPEVFEAELWRVPGMTPAQVDKLIALAQQAYGGSAAA